MEFQNRTSPAVQEWRSRKDRVYEGSELFSPEVFDQIFWQLAILFGQVVFGHQVRRLRTFYNLSDTSYRNGVILRRIPEAPTRRVETGRVTSSAGWPDQTGLQPGEGAQLGTYHGLLSLLTSNRDGTVKVWSGHQTLTFVPLPAPHHFKNSLLLPLTLQ